MLCDSAGGRAKIFGTEIVMLSDVLNNVFSLFYSVVFSLLKGGGQEQSDVHV